MNKKTEWPAKLDAAIKRKFGVKINTFFDLLGTMCYVTRPADGKTPLTDEIHKFIGQWMDKHVPVTA